MPISLETPRLIIRQFCDSDLEPFLAYRNDPEVYRYQGWKTPYLREDAADFIALPRLARAETFFQEQRADGGRRVTAAFVQPTGEVAEGKTFRRALVRLGQERLPLVIRHPPDFAVGAVPPGGGEFIEGGLPHSPAASAVGERR